VPLKRRIGVNLKKSGLLILRVNIHSKNMIQYSINCDMSEKICILDILNIPRPLKESCFSADQINLLFKLWKSFMLDWHKDKDADAVRKVNALYSENTSVTEKYRALRLDPATGVNPNETALMTKESEWVMGETNPTPFVKYIRQNPNVLTELRMSFKPNMVHNGMMESPDIFTLFQRYSYWLKNDKTRSFNFLGVMDSYPGHTNTMLPIMTKSLVESWDNFRYHAAIFNTSNSGFHWVSVLIDAGAAIPTFEYYDPMGNPIDLSSGDTYVQYINAILSVSTQRSDGKLKTMYADKVRRGFRHQHANLKCGIYNIMFIHSRVIAKKSFAEFLKKKIDTKTCEAVEHTFFNISKEVVKHKNKKQKYSNRFSDYDAPLAMLEFSRYVTMLGNVLKIEKLGNLASRIQNVVHKGLTNKELISIGAAAQEELFASIHKDSQLFIPGNIWFLILQEIMEDPYTVALRNKKGLDRQTDGVNTYSQIVSVFHSGTVPMEAQRQFFTWQEARIKQYIEVLVSINQDNNKSFSNIYGNGEKFVSELLGRGPTASFAVHFLRDSDTLVRQSLGSNYSVVTNMDTYPLNSTILKTFTEESYPELQNAAKKCDQLIEIAKQLIQGGPSYQMEDIQKQTPLIKTHPTSSNTLVDKNSSFLRNITENIRRDVMSKQFLSNNTLNPWNFPIAYSQLSKNGVKLSNGEKWKNYDVTPQSAKILMTDTEFLIFWTIQYNIMMHALNSGNKLTPEFKVISMLSLQNLFQGSTKGTTNRSIVCAVGTQFLSRLEPFAKFDETVQRIFWYVNGVFKECKNQINSEITNEFFTMVQNQINML
jgi:hypothetical protein